MILDSETWTSRTSFVLASIGAAVGLGNIWKFPYTIGSNGGAAFLIVYVAAILLIATPIMIGEMALGRIGRASSPATFGKIAADSGASPRWAWLGWLGIVILFVLLSYYSVVAGWSIAYVVKLLRGEFSGLTAGVAAATFNDFLRDPWQLSLWHALFIACAATIVARGIRKGVERAVVILMPALLLMLMTLVFYAAAVGDFETAARYLFAPDFSKLSPAVVLAAVGQAFFSVNVGFGAVLTYAAYLPRQVSIAQTSVFIVAGDTLVALLAGLMIFPLVFANGLDPADGPGLLFVTLSAAFGSMPLGTAFGAVFFFLVFLAALTSALAMLEVIVCRLGESGYRDRAASAIRTGIGIFATGLLTVLSFNHLSHIRPLKGVPGLADATIFDSLDFVVANLLMPVSGMLFAFFIGWRLAARSAQRATDLGNTAVFASWRFLLRFVVPVAILAILVSNAIPGPVRG